MARIFDGKTVSPTTQCITELNKTLTGGGSEILKSIDDNSKYKWYLYIDGTTWPARDTKVFLNIEIQNVSQSNNMMNFKVRTLNGFSGDGGTDAMQVGVIPTSVTDISNVAGLVSNGTFVPMFSINPGDETIPANGNFEIKFNVPDTNK